MRLAFIIALFFYSGLSAWCQPDRKVGAILVGNSTYTSQNFKTLGQPGNDVIRMRNLLSDLGVASGLIADVSNKMTADAMLLEIRARVELFKQRGVTDVVFYYSGHGLVMDRTGESFLVPGGFNIDSLHNLYASFGINTYVYDYIKEVTNPSSVNFESDFTNRLRDLNLAKNAVPVSTICDTLRSFNLLFISDACRDTLSLASKGAFSNGVVSREILNRWIKEKTNSNSKREAFVDEIIKFNNEVTNRLNKFNSGYNFFRNTLNQSTVRKPVTIIYGATYYNKALEDPETYAGIFTAAFDQAVRKSRELLIRFDREFVDNIPSYMNSTKRQLPYTEGAGTFELFNYFIKEQPVTADNIHKAIWGKSFRVVSLQRRATDGSLNNVMYSREIVQRRFTKDELGKLPRFRSLLSVDTLNQCPEVLIDLQAEIIPSSFSVAFEDNAVRVSHDQRLSLFTVYNYEYIPDRCELKLRDSTIRFDNRRPETYIREYTEEIKYGLSNNSVLSLDSRLSLPSFLNFQEMAVKRISPTFDTITFEIPDLSSKSVLFLNLTPSDIHNKRFSPEMLPYRGEVSSRGLRVMPYEASETYLPTNNSFQYNWKNGQYLATLRMSIELNESVYSVPDSIMRMLRNDFIVVKANDVKNCKSPTNPKAGGEICFTKLAEAKYGIEPVMYEKTQQFSVSFEVLDNAPGQLKISLPFILKYKEYIKNVYVESVNIECTKDYSDAEVSARLNGIVEKGSWPDFFDVNRNSSSEGFFKIYWDKKYGFADSSGRVIIPPVYDYVFYYSEGLAQVILNKKKFYIDAKGNKVLEHSYDFASAFRDGLASVKLDGKYGFINKAGKVVIPIVYDRIGRFNEGLTYAMKDGYFGFIDRNGEVIIPFIYGTAGTFVNGLAPVSLNDKYGYIDRSGREITKMKYDHAENFMGGLGCVKLNEKKGFVDIKGKEVTAIKYDTDIHYYVNSFNPLKLNNKWGFIDNAGKEITPFMYDDVTPFYEGFAMVKLDGRWGYIDTTGKVIIPIQYESAYIFSNGLARGVYNGKVRVLNKQGAIINSYKYESIEGYWEGLAAVKFNGRWGYIDESGKEVIMLRYEEANPFSDGLAAVKVNGKWGYINKDDKMVIGPLYDEARRFNEGMAEVRIGNKWGIIDNKNNVIIPFLYKYFYSSTLDSETIVADLDGETVTLDRWGNRILKK